MLEYDPTKSPGIGAFWAGQNQADKLQTSSVNRMLQQAQTQNVQERLKMDQAMHPLELEKARLGNTGLDLGNQQKRQQISEEENKMRMEKTDKFFQYMEKYDDPEGAMAYSGVPPQFAQRFMQAPPEARQELYKRWSEALLQAPCV